MASVTRTLSPPKTDWESVQAELADLPGEDAIVRRREAYAEYFMRMGQDVRIGEGCRFYHPERISLDDDVRINVGALIYGSGGVRIGRHARIGPRLFLHSANHDVRPEDERAFFERGYEYETVTIGDNCLLSANVSILPGANIANGTFIACGAVVIKGRYPDGCRIMGVPGRAVTPEVPAAEIETPSIALIVPGKGHYYEAAQLLIEALGLPQVRVFESGQALPSSVHTGLVLGPPPTPAPEDQPQYAINLWRLQDGDIELAEGSSLQLLDRGANLSLPLPGARRHAVAPVIEPGKSALENAATLSFYYSTKRLRKREQESAAAERLELYIAIALLRRHGGPAMDALVRELLWFLPANVKKGATEHRLVDHLAANTSIDLETELGQAILEIGTAAESTRLMSRKHAPLEPSAEDLLRHPELALAALLRNGSPSWPALSAVIESALPQCIKASQLYWLGAAAIFRAGGEDDALLAKIIDRLLSMDFFDQQQMCVRSAVGASATAYSPMLAALLLIVARGRNPDFVLQTSEQEADRLPWRGFSGPSEIWTMTHGQTVCSLIDLAGRRISRSLLDNWLMCLTVPDLGGKQYELLDQNYAPQASIIESIWLSLLRSIQHAAGRSLVRLRPWPYGRRAALSLRYDIDRNTGTEHVRNIVGIQGRELNAACGAWYAIPGTPIGQKMRNLVPTFLQEIGVHALSGADAMQGEGVTCHSGPNSEYWRGRDSILAMEQRQSLYGEMLVMQLNAPRRAWIAGDAGGRATRMLLLPIHFPLEGSTRDKTAEYFQRLLGRFRELIGSGGHAIIGSHPDLQQAILIDVIRQENLADLWCVPVHMAVERCRCVLGYGNISAIEGNNGGLPKLLSRHTLADLHVEIDLPAGDTHSVCVQLNAGVPRSVG